MPSVRRLIIAFAASAALCMVASASAQAGWSSTAPTRDYHCGAYSKAPRNSPLWIQSCVLVTPSPSGAYVQAVLRVVNTDSQRSVSPTGYTRLWVDGRVNRSDNCGATVVAAARTRWCYGQTKSIVGRGRDAYATGYVWFGAGPHDGISSPHTNGLLVYLSRACHNASGSSVCRENVGCDAYGENAGSGVIARWASNSLTARGYMVRIGTGTRQTNIRDSNALNAQIHIPIHTNAESNNPAAWDCNPRSTNLARGGTHVFHYGGPADDQLARLLEDEVGDLSPGTSDTTSVRSDLAELNQTDARAAYLEVGYHTFGPDVGFLRNPGAWAWTIGEAIDRCRGFPRAGATPTRAKECSW